VGLIVCHGAYFKYVRKPKVIDAYRWMDRERYKIARLGAMRVFSNKKRIRDLQDKLKTYKIN